jgi:hypothetical protein
MTALGWKWKGRETTTGDEKGDSIIQQREVRMYCLHCAHEKDIIFIENRKDCISTSNYGVLVWRGDLLEKCV